jgi:hypothetical protein
MPKRKSKTGVWHHRVPDFQLVYCGLKTQGETVKAKTLKRSKVQVSATANNDLG